MTGTTTANIIGALTAVFDAIMTWIISAIEAVVQVFWVAETGLTFLGVLALVALGISIFFLILGKFMAPLISNNQMKTPLTAGIEKNQQPSLLYS